MSIQALDVFYLLYISSNNLNHYLFPEVCISIIAAFEEEHVIRSYGANLFH